ncbi:galactosylceramide sulfotransferase-like [Littorina saxatilis]
MHFRAPRRFLCGLSLMASLVLTVFLMRSTELRPRTTPTLLRNYPSKALLHDKDTYDPPFLVPAKPRYPFADDPQDVRVHRDENLLLSKEGEQPQPSFHEGKQPPPLDQGRQPRQQALLEKGADKVGQRVFTLKFLEDYGDSTKPPEPDLNKQGKLGQMLIEAKKRHGDWPPDSEKNHIRLLPARVGGLKEQQPPLLEGTLKEADELWNLLQPATKKPVPDTSQQIARGHCVPKHHVFFGKVHKTGSSTVANILQRYGFTRHLNFVLPRKRIHARSYNYITMPGQQVTRDKLIPPPLGEHFDILWNHAVYDSPFYHSIMPEDTVYVSILRQPLQQFQSAFEYYGHIPGSFLYNILQKNVSNPLSLYLHNPSLYEWPGAYTSYIRNKQAQDLGMRNVHVVNDTLRGQYIQQLGREFDLVMITEFFDESLVLLRRLLCWRVRDILYVPKNKNMYKKERVFSAEDMQLHRKLNVADYDLYEFFLERFNDTVAKQGPDFHDEVNYIKNLLPRLQIHCSNPNSVSPLTIVASRWNEAFSVGPEDCKLMMKHELLFLDDIMVDAIRRYQRSAAQAMQS